MPNKPKMATPHSALVEDPFWWLGSSSEKRRGVVRGGAAISQTFARKLMEKAGNLPDPVDFGAADRNSPDARWAWDEFGGLSIDQAQEKLASHPLCYSEAFMWMGQPAFVYYYPAIDRYLRQFPEGVGTEDPEDSSASAIAGALCAQFLASDIRMLSPILDQVRDLVSYVRSHLSQLATCPENQADIDSTWQVLEAQLGQLSSRRQNKANKSEQDDAYQRPC